MTSLQVADNLPARVSAGRARNSAGMSPRTTKIQSLDGCPILSPTQQRPKHEELIQRGFAMQDMPAAETIRLLQIERRDDLPVNDQSAEVRHIFRKRSNNHVAEFLAA